MLSHGNILKNVAQCLEADAIRPDDVVLCWLPLSHIYERTVDFYQPVVAGTLVCLSESVETVVADIAEVHPTHTSCVPLWRSVRRGAWGLQTEARAEPLQIQRNGPADPSQVRASGSDRDLPPRNDVENVAIGRV